MGEQLLSHRFWKVNGWETLQGAKNIIPRGESTTAQWFGMQNVPGSVTSLSS